MMNQNLKILIVEDEMIIGAKISMYVEQMGHEVLGLLPRGEDAIQFIESNVPDLILLDINLKGTKDGIEIAQEIKSDKNIPIIFLTANSDDHHFDRAKATQPEAFISKPFKKRDLQRAIELMLSRKTPESQKASPSENILDDRIFIFDKGERIRVMYADIQYLEADRNYTNIKTTQREFLLSSNIKSIESKLPSNFIRVHRSYVINLKAIDKILESQILISGKSIPIARSMKADLLERLRML